MPRRFSIVIAVTASLLAGSAIGAVRKMPAEDLGNTPTRAAIAACTARGGQVQHRGLAGYQFCVRPMPDAGTRCTDSSQCMDLCLTDNSTPRGAPARGRCNQTNAPFGCRNVVIKGKASGGLCVD